MWKQGRVVGGSPYVWRQAHALGKVNSRETGTCCSHRQRISHSFLQILLLRFIFRNSNVKYL